MQVFIVEDSEAVRNRLIAMVESVPGAQIVGHASDAKSAVNNILATNPDLVVLDITLATGTGFDVLRAVHPRAPQIDFYMLSNFATPQYRQLASSLGARGFFDKSNEFERMRDAIASRAIWQD